MEVPANSLRDLHALHRRIGTVREQIQRGPRQVEARRQFIAKQTASQEKAQADLKALKVLERQKESQRLALENRIGELQTKINTAKSNKEYAALVSERDANMAARGALEDEILDLMLRQDEQAKEVGAAEAELKRLEEELAQLERTVEEQQSELSDELAAAQVQLTEFESSLPGEIQEVYRRLVTSRGSDALANVQSNSCSGCFTAITPQMYNQLLLNEVTLCKSCGRILYLEHTSVGSKN